MGKMSDLFTEIQVRLSQGDKPYDIAHELEIPLNWVYEAMADLENCSPYATVNS